MAESAGPLHVDMSDDGGEDRTNVATVGGIMLGALFALLCVVALPALMFIKVGLHMLECEAKEELGHVDELGNMGKAEAAPVAAAAGGRRSLKRNGSDPEERHPPAEGHQGRQRGRSTAGWDC